jgi:hypothetical protein
MSSLSLFYNDFNKKPTNHIEINCGQSTDDNSPCNLLNKEILKKKRNEDTDFIAMSKRIQSFERIIVGERNAPTMAQKQFRQSIRRFENG